MYVLCSSYIPLKQYFDNIATASHLIESGARRLPVAVINRKELGKIKRNRKRKKYRKSKQANNPNVLHSSCRLVYIFTILFVR